MQDISTIETSAGEQDSPLPRCQHDEVAEACSDCAVLEVRDTLRQVGPILEAVLHHAIIRRWLGIG